MKRIGLSLVLLLSEFGTGYAIPQNDTIKTKLLKIPEVVVIGYGNNKELDQNVGSIATVEQERMKNSPVSNTLDALAGKVSGLQVVTSSGAPNTISQVRLRGVGSINASNEPLFVIDGVPMESRFSLTFNPNDIEDISVLKDASATSIYGSRGANGVILITTKQGGYNTKPTFTFSGGYTLSSPIKPRLTAMTTQQHTDFMVEAGIIPNEYANELRALGNYDWQDLIFDNTAPTYQANLSVNGGSENTTYYMSASYFDTEGVTVGSDMDKFTIRTSINSQINSWLKTGGNLAAGHYKANNILSNVDDGLFFTDPVIGSMMIPSYQTPNDENGNPLLLLPYTNYYPSPLTMSDMFPREERELNVNGNIYVELTPIKNLTLRSSLGGNWNDYTEMNATSPLYPHSGGEGDIKEDLLEYYSWVFTNTAEYNFSLDKNRFGVLVGYESIYNNLQGRELKTTGITNDNFVNIGGGLQSAVPVYKESVSAFNSLFARVNYSYDDRYYIDLSLRNDASSRFSQANRNALFYSVGAMWKIKNEEFLSSVSFLDDLNLRASYGTSGNAGIGDYEQYAMLSKVMYGGATGWRLDTPGNENLKWETQQLLNIGVEAEFLNRYRIGMEFYNRITDDMLLNLPISGTTGFTSQMKNAGSMLNRGIDLMVSADLYRNSDWLISLNANFNYNHNEILGLFEGNDIYPDGEANILKVGSPYGTYYMQEWLGVDAATGKGMYNNGQGGVTYSAQTAPPVAIDKSWIAPYSGGIGLQVSWKKLSLIADATYAFDRYLWNRNIFFTENLMFASPVANQSTGILDYWKAEGDNTRYPSLDWQMSEGGMSYISSHCLENASYLRMKNIQISYDLAKFVKVWVSGRNLFTITKFRGFDPELDSYVATDDYPNSRQIMFGAEFTF